MTDITRDERLAHAAAHELRGATPATPVVIETATADRVTGASLTRLMLLGSHEAELERQRGALNAIDQDVLVRWEPDAYSMVAVAVKTG